MRDYAWAKIGSYVYQVSKDKNMVQPHLGELISIDPRKFKNTNIWFTAIKDCTVHNITKNFVDVDLAELKWPVIMLPTGLIIDGYHRLVKALAEGKEIQAFRLYDLPPIYQIEPWEKFQKRAPVLAKILENNEQQALQSGYTNSSFHRR